MSTEYPPELGNIWKCKTSKSPLMIRIESYPYCNIVPAYEELKRSGCYRTTPNHPDEKPIKFITYNSMSRIDCSYVMAKDLDPKWIGKIVRRNYASIMYVYDKVHSPSELSAANYQHTYSC